MEYFCCLADKFEHRTAASLLMAADRIEIGKPDLSCRGSGDGRHGSRGGGFDAVRSEGIEACEFLSIICRGGGFAGQRLVGGRGFGEELLAAIGLERGIKYLSHACALFLGKLGEQAPAGFRDANGGWHEASVCF